MFEPKKQLRRWATGALGICVLMLLILGLLPDRFYYLRQLNPRVEVLHAPIVNPSARLGPGDPKQIVYRFRADQASDVLDLLRARLTPDKGFREEWATAHPTWVEFAPARRQDPAVRVTFLRGKDAQRKLLTLHPDSVDKTRGNKLGECLVVVESQDTWLEDMFHRIGLH